MSRKALRPQWKLDTCKIREEGDLCTKKFRPLLSSEKFSAVWHWNLEKQVSMKNHRPHGWNQPEVQLVSTHFCWHNTFETSLTLSTWQVLKTQMLLLKVTPDSLCRGALTQHSGLPRMKKKTTKTWSAWGGKVAASLKGRRAQSLSLHGLLLGSFAQEYNKAHQSLSASKG